MTVHRTLVLKSFRPRDGGAEGSFQQARHTVRIDRHWDNPPRLPVVLAGAFRLLPALNQILFLTNQVQYNSSATDFVEQELEQ